MARLLAPKIVYRTCLQFLLLLVLRDCALAASNKPHIVFIVADDYGWNDIGYRNPDIYTPTLDKLAANGVILDNYYVQPICTPSRSQLMSGKYQIHTGLQHAIIWADQANGLPLGHPTMADQMRAQGYATHMVGKWHLGFYKKEYMPTHRGFDSFFGYLTGSEHYYTHVRCSSYSGKQDCGLDLRHNEDVVWNNTQYSAHLFAGQAEKIIRQHDPNEPLFLYLPFQSVHEPLQVPDAYLKRYENVQDKNRRIYSGMVTCMDEAVKNVTAALQAAGLWDDTLIVFSTDNGGQVKEGGNNWPLRGWKGSLWEGGMRGVGFVHGNMLKEKGVTRHGLMHISDWYPTLLELTGGQVNETLRLDGFNIWDAISSGASSPRTELLHNIDPLYGLKGKQSFPGTFNNQVRAAIRVGKWKLITGDPGQGDWIPPPNATYSLYSREGDDKNLWLFDVESDPNEMIDLSDQQTDVVKMMLSRLAAYNATAIPPFYPPRDPRSAPSLHGGVWAPWE